MPEAFDLLKTRRSVKPIELTGPGPTAAELDTLLDRRLARARPRQADALAFHRVRRRRAAEAGETIAAVFRAERPDATPDQVEYERKRLARAPLVIAVVSRAAPHVKIPEWEQVLSAGAAAMSLVFAAHALGFAASWITEWYAYDRRVLDALGVAPNEKHRGLRPYRPAGEAARGPAAAAARCRSSRAIGANRGSLMFYDTRQERSRPAARSVQGDRRAAPDRLDHHDERQGRDQSRALLVLQRHHRQAADRDVLQRRRARIRCAFVEETEGVRLQPRHLRSARPDERHLGAAAARRQRNEARRPRSRAVAAGEAAARRRLALRARMQVAARRARSTTSTASRSIATWCSARSSASISTTASSRTAGSTPPR